MRFIAGLILIFCLLLSAIAARADLKWTLEREMATPTSDEAIRELLKDRHVVLVGGFMTEFYRTIYLTEAKAYLDRVLPAPQADLIFPDWRQSAETNGQWLRAKLEELYAQGGHKPLWVIGHSKGGQDIVQLALQTGVEKPDLFRNQVIDKLVAVQGSIGGSPAAVAGEVGCALFKAQFAAYAPEGASPEVVCEAIKTLDSPVAKDANARWLARLSAKELAANRELVNRRLYYVRATHWEKAQEKKGTESENRYSSVLARDVMSTVLYKAHAFLRVSCGGLLGFGSNDGLVCLQDQVLDGIGRDLTAIAPLDNDHADFAVAWPVADTSLAFREAFIRALLRELSAN